MFRRIFFTPSFKLQIVELSFGIRDASMGVVNASEIATVEEEKWQSSLGDDDACLQ